VQSASTTETLRRVPLFSGLSEEQLTWISGEGTEVRLAPGQRIASQGNPADDFYVILEGEMEWMRRVGGREFHAVTLRAGEIFAELILFLEAPYPATGRALTGVRLFKLEPDSFWEMLAICPQVLRGVVRVAAERSQIHESVSQQQARLISLGNVAAGLAHELKNPAAASRRAVRDLRESIATKGKLGLELGQTLTPEALETLAVLEESAVARATSPPPPSTRSNKASGRTRSRAGSTGAASKTVSSSPRPS
jgi:CRP-like cAMP-binding protein